MNWRDKKWRKHFVRYWLQDPFWGSLDYIAHYALRYVSISLNAQIGGFLGEIAGKYRFKTANARVKRNLTLLRPELSTAERDAIATKMWRNIGQSMSEYSVLDKISDSGGVTMVNYAYAEQAAQSSQPVIFASAHTGNWEIRADSLIESGLKPLFLFQPVRNRFARRIAIKARTRLMTEHNLLEASPKAMRVMCEHLAKGHALWLPLDEFKNAQVQAPRFGRTLNLRSTNMDYVVRLAQRYQATIIPVWSKRHDDSHFSITMGEPISVEQGEQAVQETIERLDILLEQWIMANLNQWYMLHELRL
jgi:KDO2-lipid IV(A) lauroyltransferase